MMEGACSLNKRISKIIYKYARLLQKELIQYPKIIPRELLAINRKYPEKEFMNVIQNEQF
jgi:hypothetical protein